MGRSWTLKSRLHENEIFKGEFCTSISLKIVKTSSPSMSSSDSIIEVVARTFSAKTHKKDWMKNAELFVFNLSYNIASARRRRRNKAPDLSRTKLVHVLVLGKLKLSNVSCWYTATATAITYCVIFIHSSRPASELYTLVHFCQQSSIKPAPEPRKRNIKG